MRLSDAEFFWDSWQIGFSKVFSYKTEFVPIDYICIKKEKDNLIIEQNTSKTLVDVTKDIILDLMCRELLRSEPSYSAYMSMVDLKTGSCTCGSWILSYDSRHEDWCYLNKKFPMWGHKYNA